jgi:hypothetical protein
MYPDCLAADTKEWVKHLPMSAVAGRALKFILRLVNGESCNLKMRREFYDFSHHIGAMVFIMGRDSALPLT